MSDERRSIRPAADELRPLPTPPLARLTIGARLGFRSHTAMSRREPTGTAELVSSLSASFPTHRAASYGEVGRCATTSAAASSAGLSLPIAQAVFTAS